MTHESEQPPHGPPTVTQHSEPRTVAYEAPLLDTVATGTLDNYDVGEEIARGGMGVILRAYHRPLRRTVALKVMLADPVRYPLTAQRFLEEAQIASQLQHPGIAPVHEIGRVPDGRPFFAMKLIQGRTLATLLAERPTPTANLPQSLAIFEQVTQTLAYAHSHGVIHRDLKPLNIMVGAFGEVQVMDWGLAKTLGKPPETPPTETTPTDNPDEHRTQVGSIMGTFAYMPPEQARGDIEQVDRRADVFALGALLCEILTGRPPYIGTPAEVQTRATQAELEPARQRLQHCGADADVLALALHCLAVRPEDRPADATAVATAISSYRATVAEKLRLAEIERATTAAKASEQRKRRRLQSSLAIVLLGTLFIGGALIGWVQTQRTARRIEMEDLIQDAMARADVLEQQATENGNADIAKAQETLILLQQAFSKAEEAARTAESPIASEGIRHDANILLERLRTHVRQAETALTIAQREAEFLEELAEARSRSGELQTQKELVESGQRPTAVREELDLGDLYRDAFGIVGINLDEPDPARLAATIQQLTTVEVRTQALLALYYWANNLVGTAKQETIDRLMATLTLADPDPWRKRFRAADHAKDRDEQLLALAKELLLKPQPPANYLLLASALYRSPDPAIHAQLLSVLEHGHVRYANDSWLCEALGEAYAWRTFWEALNTDERQRVRAKAVEFYRAALVGRPNGMRLRLMIAVWLPATEGIAWLKEHRQAFPDRVEIESKLGDLLIENGELWEGLLAHRRAAERDPSPARIYALATALDRLKDSALRRQVWHEFTQRHPQSITALQAYAMALEECGEQQAAITVLRQALQIEPSANTAYELSQALVRNNNHTEAFKVLQDYNTACPNDAEGVAQIGLWLDSKKRRQEAIPYFRRAIQLDDSPEGSYRLANLYLTLKQSQEAVRVIRAYVQRHPKSGTGLSLLSTILEQTGDIDGALQVLEQAVAMNFSPFWQFRMANLREQKNDPADDVRFWRAYTTKNPWDSSAHYYLAQSLLRTKDDVGAVTAYRTAVQTMRPHSLHSQCFDEYIDLLEKRQQTDEAKRVWPDFLKMHANHATLWLAYGSYCRRTKNDAEAILAFRKALELNDKYDHVEPLVATLLAVGQPAEAIQTWRNYLAKRPKDGLAQNAFGHLLMERGETASALEAFRAAVMHNPDSSAARNLAHRFRDRGNPEQALELLKLFCTHHPRNANGHLAHAELLWNLRRWPDALKVYQQAYELDSTTRLAQYWAQALVKAGQPQAALHVWERHLAKRTSDADAYYFYGLLLRTTGNLPAAQRALQQAMTLAPDAEVASRLAAIFREQKMTDKALAVLREYTATASNDPQAHAALGRFLREEKQYKAALVAWRRNLELTPNDVAVRLNMAQCQLALGQYRTALTELHAYEQMEPNAFQTDEGCTTVMWAELAAGWGLGAETLPVAERVEQRRKALMRFTHFLEQRPVPSKLTPQARRASHATLGQLFQPVGFALMRWPLLGMLPVAEQAAWSAAWQQLAAYRQRLLPEQPPAP